MRSRILIPVFVITFLLSACTLPLSRGSETPQSPSQSEVQTQVSAILTSMPSSSPTVETAATSTSTQTPPGLPAATVVEPSITTQPTETQTTTSTAVVASATNVPASATPSATSTTGVTPTAPAGDPKTLLGNPTWQDNFKNDYNWPTGDSEYTSINIANGQLVLTSLSKLDGWRLSYPKLQDFYLEANITSTNCSGPDHYGLIVRVPDALNADAGYLFGLTCDGQYSIRKWDGKNMSQLVSWTSSDAILTGANQDNRLGVLAVGSNLSMYVNGVKLTSVQDGTYAEGYFGVFVGGNYTSGLSVTLSSIAYWENPDF